MGKLLVLSLSDCEEHIFNRVMAAIIDEPELDRIALPLLMPVSPSQILKFG